MFFPLCKCFLRTSGDTMTHLQLVAADGCTSWVSFLLKAVFPSLCHQVFRHRVMSDCWGFLWFVGTSLNLIYLSCFYLYSNMSCCLNKLWWNWLFCCIIFSHHSFQHHKHWVKQTVWCNVRIRGCFDVFTCCWLWIVMSVHCPLVAKVRNYNTNNNDMNYITYHHRTCLLLIKCYW